ncbi:RNA-directed DNA polymerase, eukaryota, reverse transcriptase zinc-binding domain protein [Tanacetum coccineum]
MPVTVRNKLESMRNKFFIRGDQEDKKVTWVNWKKCMASRENGWLGIGSIFGLNVGLLFKWIWRFLNHPSSLCACGIQSLYGDDGSINLAATYCSMRTTWGAILHSIFSLKQQDRNCSIASRVPLVDWSMVLRRDLRGGSELAQYNALKDAIGLKLNRLPSRVNLDRKGIDIGSILCPNCLEDIETVNHIFFNCGMAQDLWALLAKWWELDIPLCANITEWYDWLDSSPVPSKARLVLEGVGRLSCGLFGITVIIYFSLVLQLRSQCFGII